MPEVTNSREVIDSREVIERFEELEERREFWDEFAEDRDATDKDRETTAYHEGSLDDDETEEHGQLARLIEQGETLADWVYGVTLIRDDYFATYAEELAEDCGMAPREMSWPFTHIDWEAAAESLLQDYTDIDFGGVTYWAQ